jgi:nitrogen fixation NifU-like protein
MKKDEIKQLYARHIIPESRNTDYFRESIQGDLIDAYNPLCGDKYKIKLDVEEGIISQIEFTGNGCALSRASASLMADYLKGMELEEARRCITSFLKQIADGRDESEMPAAIDVLISLREFDGRTDCITLAWQALDNLKQYD